MKGINNRQKMVVRARENVQKYISQQKNLRKSNVLEERGAVGRQVDKKKK